MGAIVVFRTFFSLFSINCQLCFWIPVSKTLFLFPRRFNFDYNSIAVVAHAQNYMLSFYRLEQNFVPLVVYISSFYAFGSSKFICMQIHLKLYILILHHFAYTCQKWIYFCEWEGSRMNGLYCLPCFFLNEFIHGNFYL